LIGGDNDGELMDQMLTSNIDEYIRVMSVPYSEIKLDKYIAEDYYSKIYSGSWRNQTVAIKVIKDPSDPEKMKNLLEHTKTLKKLKHPNILDFKCFVAEDPHFCLVLGLLKGSISNLLHVQNVKPKIEYMINIGLQVSLGLKYLYSWNLVYGVLNTRLILIDGEQCVLSDYFLTYKSLVNEKNKVLTPKTIEEAYGSAYFVAPEVLKGELPTQKSDVFSVGTILWELYSGDNISRAKLNTEEILPQILKGKRACSSTMLNDLIIDNSEDFKICEYLKLIQLCWNENPEDRPTMDYLVEHFKIHSNDEFHKMKSKTVKKSEGVKSDKYETVKQIGIGGQARVFLVKNKITNQMFALKKFKETPIEELNNDLQEVYSILLILDEELRWNESSFYSFHL
jgi:serine/threonine protein kinase